MKYIDLLLNGLANLVIKNMEKALLLSLLARCAAKPLYVQWQILGKMGTTYRWGGSILGLVK